MKTIALIALIAFASCGCGKKTNSGSHPQKWTIETNENPLTDEKAVSFSIYSSNSGSSLVFEYRNGELIGYVTRTGPWDVQTEKKKVLLRFGKDELIEEQWRVLNEFALSPSPIDLIRNMSKQKRFVFWTQLDWNDPILFEYDGMGTVIETLDRLERERKNE